MSVDMSSAAITTRLRRVSAMTDLHPDRRLHPKIGMGPGAITARLREVSRLRDLCRRLGALGPASDGSGRPPSGDPPR